MRRQVVLIWLGLTLMAEGMAQTVTTPGGQPNHVPIFMGSTVLGNSQIVADTLTGNVGIGTTNLTSTLTVGGDADANNFWLDGGAATSAGTVGLPNANGPGIAFYGSSASPISSSMLFYTGMSERMRINASGNIGIGTTSPSASLHVYGSGARIGLSDITLPGSGDEYGMFTVKVSTSAAAWAGSLVSYGTNGNGLRVYNNGGAGNTAFEVVQAGGSRLRVDGLGNVGIGTTSPGYKLDVAGQIRASGGIVFSDGSSINGLSSLCQGGDYAESVDLSDDRKRYEPGDVLVIDPNVEGKFVKSTEPYSMAVAGIYSTKPGIVGRRQTTAKSPEEIPMAVVGIVPTKVSAENGVIHPGDVLVTSSTAGYAMKGTDRSLLTGAIVGKAMGSLVSGSGVIEVLVSLQ